MIGGVLSIVVLYLLLGHSDLRCTAPWPQSIKKILHSEGTLHLPLKRLAWHFLHVTTIVNKP